MNNLDDPELPWLWPGAETEQQAAAEDATRLQFVEHSLRTGKLDQFGPDEFRWRSLKAALDGSADTGLGGSMASMRALRLKRRAITSGLLAVFADYPDCDLRTITIVNQHLVLTPIKLFDQAGSAFVKRFRADLNRIDIASHNDPFLAFLDVEFDPRTERFTVHWHGLTTAAKAAFASVNLSRVGGYTTTATGGSAIRREPVQDRPRQFSYLLKPFWRARATFINERGERKRRRQTMRIPEPWGSLSLRWLHQQRLLDLVLMHRIWSRRLGGTDAGKQLALLIEHA